MGRPRLLLIPEFTEVTWTIKPRLEEWAEVASYDPPGVGAEPLPHGDPRSLTRQIVADRGLQEIDERGWERFFILSDGWAIPVAVRIAQARHGSILGMALGHASLSFRRDGERPATSPAVYDAMTQLVHQDHEAFIRYGIAQSTGGSVGEELAQRMLDRFPKELMLIGWERVTADDEPFGDALRELDLPMLLAKHDGCLMHAGGVRGRRQGVAERPLHLRAEGPLAERGLCRRSARVLRRGQPETGAGARRALTAAGR